jgi:high affinity sulfate transporter 1
MKLNLFPSLHGYNRSWIRGDAIAGLTVWAVLVPEALAYATIAGVSPVVGLYAAPPALLLYALFGSSRHLVVGPMSATAALSAAAVAQVATAGSPAYVTMTAAVAIVVGVLGIAAGLAHLGFVANFISEPVLKGFIIGLALTIIAGQLPKLFGVEKGSGNFFEQMGHLLANLDQTNGRTLLVGLISLAIVMGLREWLPVIPGSLVAVAFGVIAVVVFNLDAHGVAIVGHIDQGLPSVGVPDASLSQYLQLAGSAAGILLVGFAEGLGAAKTYAARNHYEVDPNRELIGLGAANLGGGLCSGMVVNGSLSKTAVNGGAGARSQVSGLVVAVLTVVTLLFLTGLFENLPEATLAAVVIAAVIELVDVRALRRLYRVYSQRLARIYGLTARADFIAASAAMLGVLIFDTLPGLFIGITVSALLLVYRASRPHITTLGRVPGTVDQYTDAEAHIENIQVPGVVLLRVEGGLFFANADHIRNAVRRAAVDGTRVVVIDAESVPFIDVTAAEMLDTLADGLQTSGVALAVAHEIGQVRDVVRTATDRDAPVRVFPTLQAAVAWATAPAPADQAGQQQSNPERGTSRMA